MLLCLSSSKELPLKLCSSYIEIQRKGSSNEHPRTNKQYLDSYRARLIEKNHASAVAHHYKLIAVYKLLTVFGFSDWIMDTNCFSNNIVDKEDTKNINRI